MTKIFNFKASNLFLICFAIIFILITQKNQEDNSDKLLELEVQPFQITSGWGYEILIDKKTYIHQQFIPAITGRQSFLNKEDAIKAGNLVIVKIKNKMNPSLTRNDLVNSGISFDTTLQ